MGISLANPATQEDPRERQAGTKAGTQRHCADPLPHSLAATSARRFHERKAAASLEPVAERWTPPTFPLAAHVTLPVWETRTSHERRALSCMP